MKPPRKNRFQEGAGERALQAGQDPEPAAGPAHVIDVEGLVTYEGEQPLVVTAFGHSYPFEQGSLLVRIRDVTYQLVRIGGRAQLVPARV